MAGLWHGKLKRRDLEEVYDDFAEFSLSSPARKIRRLVGGAFSRHILIPSQSFLLDLYWDYLPLFFAGF